MPMPKLLRGRGVFIPGHLKISFMSLILAVDIALAVRRVVFVLEKLYACWVFHVMRVAIRRGGFEAPV